MMSKFKDIGEQYLDVERDPKTNEWLFLTVDEAIPIDPNIIMDSEESWAEDAIDTMWTQLKNEFERGEFYEDQLLVFGDYDIEELLDVMAGPASLQNYYKSLDRCGISREGKALEPIFMAIFDHYREGFRAETLLKALFLKMTNDYFDKKYSEYIEGNIIAEMIEGL